MEEKVKLPFELTKEFLNDLKSAIESGDASFVGESLVGVNPVDITGIIEELGIEESNFLIDQLPPEVQAEVISELDDDVRIEILKVFNVQKIASIISMMESDDAADIIMELPVKTREEIIVEVDDKEKASNIIELLRYEEDCAGGLMAKEVIKAYEHWSVLQCVDEIRRQAEIVHKIYSVYVVDENERLVGRVPLKTILISDDNTPINEIYEKDIISVITYYSEEEVASVMRKYDQDSIPVVNVEGKLVGRITIDDIVDVISEQMEEERQLMSGISEDVEEDDSIWMLSRARLPWLIIGLVGGILGAKVIGIFEEDLVQLTAIAFFIPLIMATGGNVGIQSSALVVQSLADPPAISHSLSSKLIKTLLVALINGILLSLFVSGLVWLIDHDMKLSFVVSVALFSVVILASVLGTLIPLILDRVKINPALASGPFITTFIDLLGLGVYFTVAHLMYNFS